MFKVGDFLYITSINNKKIFTEKCEILQLNNGYIQIYSETKNLKIYFPTDLINSRRCRMYTPIGDYDGGRNAYFITDDSESGKDSMIILIKNELESIKNEVEILKNKLNKKQDILNEIIDIV